MEFEFRRMIFPQSSAGMPDHTVPEHTARAPHLDLLPTTGTCKAQNPQPHSPQHPV